MNWKRRRLETLLLRVFLGRPPWIFAILFLSLMVFPTICTGLLFANMCEGRFRVMPELPDRLVVFLDWLGAWSLLIALPMGVVILILPIVPLLFRRAINAYVMFVYNLGAVFVGVFLFAAICFMGLTTGDQVEIAQKNLICEDSRVKKRLPKFRQNCWKFCNGRFTIWRQDEKDNVYWLVDEKWRRATDGRSWEDRVLLEDIAEWKEAYGDLYLLTESGEKYVLNYMKESVCRYPDSRQCPQCGKSDAVFKELKERDAGCRMPEKMQ